MTNTPRVGNSSSSGADSKNRSNYVDPFIGITLEDRYQIVDLIGTGGWGNVYKAKHLTLDLHFAIKIVHHQHLRDEQSLRRFEQEAQLLSRVENQHIVKIIDHGLEPAPFIVMEYVPGISLSDWLKTNGSMPAQMAIELFLQLCDALSAAEAMRIVHRDLKPANILLRTNTEEIQCKILDFGLAKFVDMDSAVEKITSTGDILGSPAYMPPEQWKGYSDNRSDIYSLGCIMYEMLAGKPAFSAQFGIDYIYKHLSETPEALARSNEFAKLPPGLEDIVKKCMEKSPADRYQSSSAISADLKKLKEGRKPKVFLPARMRAMRRRTLLTAGAIVFASLMGAYISDQAIMDRFFPQLHLQAGKKSAQNSNATPEKLAAMKPMLMGLPDSPDKWQNKNLDQWTEAIEEHPTDAKLFYSRAMLHLSRREYAEAQHDFSAAIQLNPNFAEAYAERSILQVLLSNFSDYEKPMEDAEAAIKARPDYGHAYFARGFVLEQMEQNEPAIMDFNKAIVLGEKSSDVGKVYFNVYDYLSRAYLNLGRVDEADKIIDKGMQVLDARYKPMLYTQRALVHCMKQNFAGAISDLNLVSKQEKSGPTAGAWILLAHALAGAGRSAEAEEACSKGLVFEAGLPQYYIAAVYKLRAEFWRTTGKVDEAIEDYTKAIQVEGSAYYYSLRLRARCYVEKGQLKEALADLKEAASLNAKSARTLSLLAMVENRLGLTQKSQRDLSRAFALPTHPPMIFVNRADIELKNGLPQAALADLNQAIATDPNLKEAYELREKVNLTLGHREEAGRDRLRASKLVSHFEFVP